MFQITGKTQIELPLWIVSKNSLLLRITLLIFLPKLLMLSPRLSRRCLQERMKVMMVIWKEYCNLKKNSKRRKFCLKRKKHIMQKYKLNLQPKKNSQKIYLLNHLQKIFQKEEENVLNFCLTVCFQIINKSMIKKLYRNSYSVLKNKLTNYSKVILEKFRRCR